MSYLKFFGKRTFHNPLTYVVTAFILIVMLVTLTMNLRTYRTKSLVLNTQQDLAGAYRLQRAAKQNQAKYTSDTDDYAAAVADLRDARAAIRTDKAIIKAMHHQNYRHAYSLALAQNNAGIKVAKHSKADSAALLRGLQRESLRLKALKQVGLPEQSEDYPVDGLGFLMSSLMYILPVLFTVLTVFVLSQVYGERFIQRHDIGTLFPFRHGSIDDADISTGLLTTGAIGLAVSVFTFAIAALISGLGHWSYPFFAYNAMGKMTYVTSGSILLRALPLIVLYLIFTVLVTELVTVLARSRMVSLFISLLAVVVLPLITLVVVPIQSFAQLLPTTYMFGVLTATGELSKTLNGNLSVTVSTGSVVLLVSCILLYGLIHLVQNSKASS